MRGETVALTSLEGTVEPLRAYFNAHPDVPRFLAIVSPTCGPCVRGSEAVKRIVLDGYPQAEIAVGLVWIDMLRGDSREAAVRRASAFGDSRVRQFHDPRWRAGRTVAESLGWGDEVAWDVYLFYPESAEWTDLPPTPVAWAHQLGGWATAAKDHFRTGEDLVATLHEAMEGLAAA